MRARSLAAAVLAVLALGCDISPQPAPPGNSPEIRVEAITLNEVDATTVELRGGPGAAPASTTLAVANLETAGVDATVDTDSSGGFALVLGGQLPHVFRLSAVTSDGSDELDLSGTTSGAPAVEVLPAFDPCLAVSPVPLAVGQVPLAAPIEQRQITLDNTCAQALTINDVSLRDGGEFVLLGPGPGQLPLTITPSQQATVEIGFKALTPGVYGDFVRIRFTDAAGPRRIVAMSGESVP